MTTRRAVIAVLGVLVGAYLVLFLVARQPLASEDGRMAPAVALHVMVMVTAFVAVMLAIKDIQSNAALDNTHDCGGSSGWLPPSR